MNTSVRYVLLVLGIIISLHYILSFSNEDYGKATSLSNIQSKLPFGPKADPYKNAISDDYYVPTNNSVDTGRRANAAFVILARNGDLKGIMYSIKQLEDRFNRRFNYPYVFLNEREFDDKFKKGVQGLTDAKVSFGLIPQEHWVQPKWVDEDKASKSRKKMEDAGVIYGGSLPYRNMCRFNSGFFYRHELLKDIKYYWRVEPDVDFFCDVNFDPFLVMEDNKYVYGFTVSLYEYIETIPTLWDSVKKFTKKHPELVSEGNGMSFVSDDGGETYNRCHFWSNFEIGDLDLWRGEAYSKFFDFLDEEGGFYYERWGDAPVHSIGAALFAKKEQIHFFNEIGYRHNPFQHCPQGDLYTKGKCYCQPEENFDYEGYSCLKRYDGFFL